MKNLEKELQDAAVEDDVKLQLRLVGDFQISAVPFDFIRFKRLYFT